jgi:hypothetical protein
VGGPIIKDKLFFYYNNEGIRYVLPAGGAVDIPSPQFQKVVLDNLAIVSPASVPYYTKAFGVYNNAPGYSRAVPVTLDILPDLGCGTIYNTDDNGDYTGTTTLSGITFGVTPCAYTFQDATNNLNTERFQSVRVDWNISDKDKVNFRYKGDRGVQATSTDPINSAFSANSVQPSDEGQMSWTRVLNNNMVNQFIFSDLYYVALFGPPNMSAATSVFPNTLAFNDGAFQTLGNFYGYPSGRKVEQYQFVDDFTWTKGAHGIKLGVNFRRNDISDFSGSSATTGEIVTGSMDRFANGLVDGGGYLAQSFTKAPEVPVALYSLGLYLQDEWRINRKLKLTYGLRLDSNSDEACQKTCYARPTTSFEAMDHTSTTPYNSIIKSVKTAFPGLEFGVWGPRGGFDWTPFDNKTVIRGGFGLFSDLYPGVLGDSAITNLPNVVSFTIRSGPVSPAASGSTWTQASTSAAAVQSQFAAGGTLASIKAAVAPVTFSTPSLNAFNTNVKNPKYMKWNLEIERSIGDKTAVSINYVGNHGYDLFIINRTLNAYCSTTNCKNGFEGLPTSAPDPRFANVREYDNGGIANYNGLTFTLTQRSTKGFTGNLNYTWSHTLDDLYEGGIEPYFGTTTDTPSLRVAIDPYNVAKYNYSNADQDARHVITGNFYWELPFKSGDQDLNSLIGGWSFSGTVQFKTGSPFTVYNTAISSGVLSNATSGMVLPVMTTKGLGSCGKPNANSPCFLKTQFNTSTAAATVQTTWGGGYNSRRNSFWGPGYFDSDLSLSKNIRITEKGPVFTVGIQAINFMNHPNFDRPVGNLNTSTNGKILATVGQPNSPYGNFEGSAANGRLFLSNLKVRF